ncbi:MAG: sigma-70 family RNA polymerase sigma factor [Salinivirgaceae bacterium]|nr:sigma-70 family RNA polymerase sigma factor [Salinivirgaceae bacterium]
MDLTTDFWTKAYNRNIGKLTGVCYRYVADRQLAEDLAHDAFMAAMEKSDSFRGTGQFDAWLRRITVNTALQHLRTQAANQLYENILTDNEMDNSDNRNIIAQVDFSQEELLAAVNQLPEHHRLVFNMYVIDGYTHAQIAEELNISENTSKSHLMRARKRLQEILTEEAHKKQRKRAWLLFFIPHREGFVDKLFQHSFSDFSLAPAATTSTAINFGAAAGHVTVGSTAAVTTGIATATVAAGVGVGAIVMNADSEPVQEPEPIIIAADSTVIQTDTVIDEFPADTLNLADTLANLPLEPVPKAVKTKPKEEKKTVVVKKKIIRHRKVVVTDTVSASTTNQ